MNILIVDDEEVIRRWLGMLLAQQDAFDCQTFFAENGEQALAQCGREHMDLVITDIRMPGGDGLDLLRKLKAQYPGTPVAVLSAYDDFEYVRAALQNGALDYIPKAEMSLEDIRRVLEKAQKSAEGAQWDHMDFRKATARLRELSQTFRHFLQSDRPDDAFLEEVCPALVLDRLCMALLTLERRTEDPSRRRAEIVALTDREMKRQGLLGVTIWLPETERYCLLYQAPASAGRDTFYRFFGALDPVLEQETGRVVWCSIHLRCQNGIRAAYRQALMLLVQKMYYGKQAGQPQDGENGPADEASLYETLQRDLERERFEEAVAALRRAVTAWHERFVRPAVLHRILRAAYTLLAGPFADGLKQPIWEQLRALGNAVEGLQTREQTEAWLEELQKQYAVCAHSRRRMYSLPVQQTVEYLQQHFEEPVTLRQLSDRVHLNQNYFSGLFKRETGVNYHEYLESLRIRQARKLIRSGKYTMAEIAAKTGFPTQHAFAKTFRRLMGQSPMEFKKKNT